MTQAPKRLEDAIRACERGEPHALGQLRRWLDDAESPPDRILGEARRMLELARHADDAPGALAAFKQELEILIARMDRLPRDVL